MKNHNQPTLAAISFNAPRIFFIPKLLFQTPGLHPMKKLKSYTSCRIVGMKLRSWLVQEAKMFVLIYNSQGPPSRRVQLDSHRN